VCDSLDVLVDALQRVQSPGQLRFGERPQAVLRCFVHGLWVHIVAFRAVLVVLSLLHGRRQDAKYGSRRSLSY
jgi:hypothetical protein